jgi:hypothetical protein
VRYGWIAVPELYRRRRGELVSPVARRTSHGVGAPQPGCWWLGHAEEHPSYCVSKVPQGRHGAASSCGDRPTIAARPVASGFFAALRVPHATRDTSAFARIGERGGGGGGFSASSAVTLVGAWARAGHHRVTVPTVRTDIRCVPKTQHPVSALDNHRRAALISSACITHHVRRRR